MSYDDPGYDDVFGPPMVVSEKFTKKDVSAKYELPTGVKDIEVTVPMTDQEIEDQYSNTNLVSFETTTIVYHLIQGSKTKVFQSELELEGGIEELESVTSLQKPRLTI